MSEHAMTCVRELQDRFELEFEGGVAFATFQRQGPDLVVMHTEVPRAFEGAGLGSRLVEVMFLIARDTGRSIVPACSFVASWARRHPEFKDVISAR